MELSAGGDGARDKTLAILTYIDASKDMLEEFGWLYRSWIFSGAWKTSDIIAVCHPDVIPHLPKEPGIVTIPMAPVSKTDSRWSDYPFINSIRCLVGEHTAGLPQKYTHILRTDADVFLTENLVDFRPDLYVFGRGRYVQLAEVRTKIVEFAAKYGIEHRGVYNCGSSLLGPAQGVLNFLYNQSVACEWLWEEFRDDPGVWPGWSRNTLTMYAAEIVANHYYDKYLYNAFLNVLDFETYRGDRIKNNGIYTIHALHTLEYWSKFSYRAGKYKDHSVGDLDISRVNQYCHWLAEISDAEVKARAFYPF